MYVFDCRHFLHHQWPVDVLSIDYYVPYLSLWPNLCDHLVWSIGCSSSLLAHLFHKPPCLIIALLYTNGTPKCKSIFIILTMVYQRPLLKYIPVGCTVSAFWYKMLVSSLVLCRVLWRRRGMVCPCSHMAIYSCPSLQVSCGPEVCHADLVLPPPPVQATCTAKCGHWWPSAATHQWPHVEIGILP